MCGIAGYFGLDLSLDEGRSVLDRMCRAMAHRGPDDQGMAVWDGSGMAMRRLSVVDLAGGAQPMSGPGGATSLVFNGEIYNHRELRARLESEGTVFHTSSDTEVLLGQLVARGTSGIDELNGMFAFALQDLETGRLLLCRDRMGVKPLYYWTDGPRLIYASELKALLASGLVPQVLEPRAVWDYLSFRYVPAPRTMWQGVFKLPPGHILTMNRGQDCPGPVRYWDYPLQPPREDLPDSECDRQFAELFDDAVGIRLVADVPVGIMLSGGLDSSAVAAVAARRMATVKTFSVSFADSPATDERAYARLVAGHIGAEHHEVVIGQREFVDYLPDFVRDTDEPLADLASIPLRYLSSLARRHVTVVLSGEGSDEMLGGYDLDLWMDIWEREKTDYRFREAPNMTNYMDSARKSALMGRGYPDSLEPLAREIRTLGPRHPLEQMLRSLCRDWLVEDLLMKADKMSMACSLELRTPFLDYRLVEWAWTAPVRMKVGRDETGQYVTKRALRRFAKDLLPEVILSRSKLGFPVPVYDWLSGRLSGLARELLEGEGSWLRRMFDPQAVAGMLAAGLDPSAPVLDKHRLWNLMILELWGRQWGVS